MQVDQLPFGDLTQIADFVAQFVVTGVDLVQQFLLCFGAPFGQLANERATGTCRGFNTNLKRTITKVKVRENVGVT